MNSTSSSSRIIMLADRRTPPADGGVRIQRYRLARVARGVPQGHPSPRPADFKRA